ncbi:hypothetical protein LSH36_1g14030 [Paralvinella palmiformis]|uniref:C3H1-type domain-containing protein n=1 Tax=Paralvinella palmiformis TaxID=53620 RepID=A0AAD9KG34_9ANNE|nr:hypothetical protein LSH36_1g14030 [Paralvinella palmiformis]
MTVENLFTLLGSNQMAAGAFTDVVSLPLGSHAIQIPASRRRHPSFGSTGSSYDSGGSQAGSPPVQELLTLHLPQPTLPGSPKSHGGVEQPSFQDAIHGSHKNNVNPTRYKTELCRPFEESGYCKYGEKCQFAHGREELRSLSRHPKYKTELCRTYHKSGFCPYGPRCHFIHNEDDEKLNRINQQKHQQILQQVAQHIAQQQQQVLCQLTSQAAKDVLAPLPGQLIIPQACAITHLKPLEMAALPLPMSLGSTVDTPPASITDSPLSLSPVSSVLGHDDLFGGAGIPTPPPGFTAPPPSLYQKPLVTRSALATFPSSLDAALPSPPGLGSGGQCATPPIHGPSSLFQKESSSSVPSSPSRLPIFSRFGI